MKIAGRFFLQGMHFRGANS
ncbi:hypothetical protein BDE02_17G010400 [Populus trichocarpa]|nr:hypothetical protein BDE02_17G010400 [Populus trichocarpa]